MKASGQTRFSPKNRNIKLLDQYAIARDKQFCVIETAGKVYFIGITNHTMTLLDTFDAAAFAELTENNDEPVPWNMTPVGQYGNKLTKKVVEFIASKTGKIKPDDNEESVKEKNTTDFSETMTQAQLAADDASSADQPESSEDD